MTGRLVWASLRRRARQLALIALAVGVAAASSALLAGFSVRARQTVSASLGAFGPNLAVRPQVGGPETVPAAALQAARGLPGVLAVTPVHSAAGLERIELRVEPDRLGEAVRRIEAATAGVEARPLNQASAADARLSRRLTWVLAAMLGVSLALALLSVAGATTALVGERRAEIGLFLALGYTTRRVGRLLAVELLTAALVAALAGAVIGEVSAWGLSRRLLASDAGLSLTWSGSVSAMLAAVLVVGSAAALALSRVERVEAARVLKGE